MKRLITKIKPTKGFSHAFHVLLMLLLPLLVYVFVRINLPQLAILIVLLSKWRMLVVRPRHWLAIIRANSVDLVVGISIVIFMSQTNIMLWQLVWMLVYMTWLLFIKPGSTVFGVAMQATIAQVFGLMAVYAAAGASPLWLLILATWAVCYSAARHFFSAFDEPYGRFFSDVWAFFGASLAFILGHWLLFYGLVAQPTLLLNVLGFGLATMYYLDKSDRLSTMLRRQFIFIMLAIITVVIVFSDWGDKAI